MNEVFQVITLAVIQGLTELLPISSSAHLSLIPWLLGWPEHSLALDAALHLGTAISVGAYFAKEIIKLFRQRSRLLWYILVANIPAITVGVFAEKFIENYLHQSPNAPAIFAVGLITFGVAMWIVDKNASSQRQSIDLKLADAIKIGFAQAIALIPGVSRSGITITTARYLKLNRADAAYFSFLLGMPVTFGAGLYKSASLFTQSSTFDESWDHVLIGIMVAAFVGWLVIKWLLKYVQHHSLAVFMWYRIIFGTLILILFFS